MITKKRVKGELVIEFSAYREFNYLFRIYYLQQDLKKYFNIMQTSKNGLDHLQVKGFNDITTLPHEFEIDRNYLELFTEGVIKSLNYIESKILELLKDEKFSKVKVLRTATKQILRPTAGYATTKGNSRHANPVLAMAKKLKEEKEINPVLEIAKTLKKEVKPEVKPEVKEQVEQKLKKVGKHKHTGYYKLTEEQVKEILSLKSEFTQKELAEAYNISQSQMSRLINNNGWKSLK